MKTITQILLFILLNSFSYAQTVAFAADKMNVLYIGVDNPITIVAENTDCSKMKITTNNVTLSGKDCKYVARVENQGTASITVTYKVNGKVKNTQGVFRVKEVPIPIFKVGTGQKRLPLVALKAQQYVRADLENIDINIVIPIDSFTISVFSKETSTYKEVKNIGNKISDEVKQFFETLKPEDEILFKDIFSHKFTGDVMVLDSVLIRVY